MNLSFYVADYLVSVLISAAVGAYALARGKTKGAVWFAISTFSQGFWTLGHVFELLNPTLEGKVFWDDLQFVGTMGWVLAFCRFAESYAHATGPKLRIFWFVNVTVSGSYVTLVFTDRLHHLIRPTKELVKGDPFGMLVYPFTPVTLFATAFMLGAFGVAVGVLLRHLARAQPFFRAQIAFVIAGALVPIVGVVLTAAGFAVTLDRDTTPLTFALGDLLAAWGLFHYGFLDLVPIARELVIENLRDSVVVTDASERVLDMNAAAARAIGRPASEVIGQSTRDVFSSFPGLVERFEQTLDARVDLSLDIHGEHHDFDLTVTPLRDRTGVVLGRVAVTHDVTALKVAERALAERNVELEAAYRDLDAFTHSVSHDLRAPLRTIERFAEILHETQKGKFDARGEEHLELIRDGTQRMRRLFEDLLEFSRLGRKPVQRRDVDLAEVANAALSEFAAEIAKRRADVQVEALPHALADASLLRQVYSNLIGNALKYSQGKETTRILLGAMSGPEPSAPAVYFVRDNGVGFDMRYKEKLFHVFQRLHGPDEFEGSGVGLAIAASIVVRHGGKIWAESTVGEGATFYFTLAPPEGSAMAPPPGTRAG